MIKVAPARALRQLVIVYWALGLGLGAKEGTLVLRAPIATETTRRVTENPYNLKYKIVLF